MAAAQVVAARECRRCLMENRRSMIELKKIVKRFYEGKPNELEILHGIDLTVKEGEFVSIVGESGSGKSTLMNIIGALPWETIFLPVLMWQKPKIKNCQRSGTNRLALFFRLII